MPGFLSALVAPLTKAALSPQGTLDSGCWQSSWSPPQTLVAVIMV